MTVLLFIIVLAVLVFVHELGHFLFAKWSGIKVEEFGIGFPPRLFSWRPEGSETLYSFNAIPFGGFVRVLGEDGGELEDIGTIEHGRSFTHKSKIAQTLFLSGGVLFNIVFAWILFSLVFALGMPAAVTDASDESITDPRLTILSVLPESPAEEAGIETGDVVRFVEVGGEKIEIQSVEDFQEAIRTSERATLEIERNGEQVEAVVSPEAGIAGSEGPVIGVNLQLIGTLDYSGPQAMWEGLKFTGEGLYAITAGLALFTYQAISGDSGMDVLTGPVGIAGMVGDAASIGIASLLVFSAFISLNLAVLNLLPIPALDGGRLVFVAIEAISRKRVPEKVSLYANVGGFALLILLMVVVTINDIVRLF